MIHLTVENMIARGVCTRQFVFKEMVTASKYILFKTQKKQKRVLKIQLIAIILKAECIVFSMGF
jgi:hypothetical protein